MADQMTLGQIRWRARQGKSVHWERHFPLPLSMIIITAISRHAARSLGIRLGHGFTGTPRLRSALHTTLIGSCAASAAFLLAGFIA